MDFFKYNFIYIVFSDILSYLASHLVIVNLSASYRVLGCRWPLLGSWCSRGSLESPSGSETYQPRPVAVKAPWAPCSCGSGCGGESPGADRSAQHDGAPSTETDLPLRPPCLSWQSLFFPLSPWMPLCLGFICLQVEVDSSLKYSSWTVIYSRNRILK